ncbi:oxaloacetate decarboxylase [Nocardioides sp.]|uniref:isocitrate lyase/PEP mutase family protein n=1 Tax=Nocardioides sp. TaxID=35761 RepID=UPI00356945F4
MTASRPSAPQALRALLAGEDLVALPGAYDAVSALLARRAGARGLHLSGATVSAVDLGVPDLGFVHATDIARRATVLSEASGLPVLADADTGYGNALQARHTTIAYAAAGVAGLHLEDQVAPKRCGHLGGKAVVDLAEAAGRIRAAVDADSGLVIVARTDALSVLGVDAVLERCRAFVDAGADAVFVEGADLAVLEAVHAALPGVPLVHSRSEAGGPVEDGPTDVELAALGVRIVIHPVSAVLAAARAQAEVYAAIMTQGNAGATTRITWSELTDLVGLPDQLALEEKYS